MKYAHLVRLTVFSYEHEDGKAILDSFLKFFPFRLEDNKIALRITNATGFNEKKIEVLEVTLAKDSLINQFLKNLRNKLDESQKSMILHQSASRLDNKLDFFIRFDKDSRVNDGKLQLTDSGKCFHLKISIAAFPRKREIALNMIEELFSHNESLK